MYVNNVIEPPIEITLEMLRHHSEPMDRLESRTQTSVMCEACYVLFNYQKRLKNKQ
jgi:hypothetical protein